ncbi:MAG: DNA polymerase I [Phycisphaerales bacterium]|jgi:DNA polymerase-1|nr:DNA polymerase I [Phycisphaerales bacterium]
MPTLYLIDGYAQFFRAYHAIRTPMTSPVTKEPTNMTFGFVGMLLKLLRGEGKVGGKPAYVALVLDVSGDRGTFRSQLYPDYKAHRPPPPEDLRPQVDRCLAILREIGVPILGSEGYEADDVIATLVKKLKAQHPDLNIRIISKDKDLKQLLRDGVEMFDIHTDSVIDTKALMESSGLRPDQIVDMLALMGDSVDNVPGVEGVGEKTSAELIKTWGTLDNLLANADKITGKRGEKIRASRELLALSRSLVTLHDDAPLESTEGLPLDQAQTASLRLEKLIPILKELGFNRYQDEVRALLGQASPGASAGTTSASGGASASARAGSGAAASKPKPASADDAPLFADSLFGQGEAPKAAPVPEGAKYECVTTLAELRAVVERLRSAPAVAVDTETTSLSVRDARLCGISLCVEPGHAWYIPIRSPEPTKHLDEKSVLDALRPILEDEHKPKYGHNLKYDLMVLRGAGLHLRGIAAPGACDSMVASYLIDSSRSSHSLDALGLALLGMGKQSISELIGSGKAQRTFESVPIELATPYAAGDADLSLRLAQKMLPEIRAMGLASLFHDLELPLVEVLAELEWNGILVDPRELDRQRERLEARVKELAHEIDRHAMESIGRTFDPDSPKQLGAALFNKPGDVEPGLGLGSIKRTKTGHSTDAEVLEKLAQDAEITTPIPSLILEYRQLTKLVSTYLVALKDAINAGTKRVHTSFNQTVAATGRLASSDPNLQNIPIRTDIGRDIRKAFIAPAGRVLVTADYSQIELRLLAHLSRDPALIEAFQRDEDIHTAVAAQIHSIAPSCVTREQRSGAKMVNFGIVYGITPFGLARRLGIDNTKAAEIIDGYKRRFAGITTFLEECVEQARRFGYVETMLKRRRLIPDIESTNPQRRALAERTAINSVVQGSAADLIKLAMVDLHKHFAAASPGEFFGEASGEQRGEDRRVLMLLQIHDELVFEAPEELAESVRDTVVRRMEQAMTLRVPLKADAHIGRNWYESK